MRHSTSILCALLTGAALWPGVAGAQAFGRFGYADRWTLPGFSVDRSGFVAAQPAADRVRFPAATKVWKPTLTSDTEQSVALDGTGGGPSGIRATLTSPGFAMYFPSGFVLKVASTGAPYLTWKEGSASANLPTPDESWIVLSFRDAQPPIVFGFPKGPTSLKIVGKPGNWAILGPKAFAGWVRVGLPAGVAPVQASTAASLGQLAVQAAALASMWTQPAPQLTSTDIRPDEDGVTATWTFDRPGALVPRAVTFANIGGYPLEALSPVRRLPFMLGDGPIDVCDGAVLKVRLPVRQIPAGRALGIGHDSGQPIATVSPLDIPSVVELALDNLPAARDVETRRTTENTLNAYLSQASYVTEPHTGQLLPYDARGSGIDLAAANAFLMQAGAASTKSRSDANSLLTSVSWRRDWLSWLPWAEDGSVARRAAALAALAGALCSEGDRRLAAAMFQAGLSGELGLQIWRSRHVDDAGTGSRLEAMHGMRAVIFRLTPPRVRPPKPDPEAQFAEEILSPIRVFGDTPLEAVELARFPALQWTVPAAQAGVFYLESRSAIELDPVLNLPRFHTDRTRTSIEVRYTPAFAGPCGVRLLLPPDAGPLPVVVPVPRYEEKV